MPRYISLSSLLTILLCAVATFGQSNSQQPPPSISDLRNYGTLNFPQQYAQVICDRSDLRVSVYNNDHSIFVQAILWGDGDSGLGKTHRGKAIGDFSALLLHLDDSPKRTFHMDRNYYLDPWPSQKGLYFTVILTDHATSTMKRDSDNRGKLSYVLTSDGKRVRVDSYLIPLLELAKRPGDTINLAYYAYSPQPEFTIDSATSSRTGRYFDWDIPVNEFHKVTLQAGNTINVRSIP